MSETRPGPVKIEVLAARAPDGRTMVLLQFPDAHVLMSPDGAEQVAEMLIEMADIVRAVGGG